MLVAPKSSLSLMPPRPVAWPLLWRWKLPLRPLRTTPILQSPPLRPGASLGRARRVLFRVPAPSRAVLLPGRSRSRAFSIESHRRGNPARASCTRHFAVARLRVGVVVVCPAVGPGAGAEWREPLDAPAPGRGRARAAKPAKTARHEGSGLQAFRHRAICFAFAHLAVLTLPAPEA